MSLADEGPAQPVGFGQTVDLGTVSVPPRPALPVEPSPIAGMEHLATVGTTAPLTAAGSTVKPDRGGQLGPIRGVERAVLRPDGHWWARLRFKVSGSTDSEL